MVYLTPAGGAGMDHSPCEQWSVSVGMNYELLLKFHFGRRLGKNAPEMLIHLILILPQRNIRDSHFERIIIPHKIRTKCLDFGGAF